MATKRRKIKSTPYMDYVRVLDAVSKGKTEEEIIQAAAFMIVSSIMKYPFEQRLELFEVAVQILSDKMGMYEKSEGENGKTGRTQKREAGNGHKSEA